MALLLPPYWNSVNHPIVYKRTFPIYTFPSTYNLGGYVRLNIGSSSFNMADFPVGRRVYISSGGYIGNHVVTAVWSNGCTLGTLYDIDVDNTTGQVSPVKEEVVKVFAGYKHPHPGFEVYPYRKVAEFTAIPGVNGYTEIDVSRYLKSEFIIRPPVMGRDWALLMPFWIEADGINPGINYDRYCMNSAVTGFELDTKFNTSYAALQRSNQPIHISDGQIIYSIFGKDDAVGPYVLNVFGLQGTANPGGVGFDAIGSTFTVG